MTDDIIMMKLKEVGLSYVLTPKHFQIPRENNMDSKAPKWFAEFEKRNNNRLDIIESKVDNNTEMILKLETKVDKNSDMILKAHPEFKK